MWPLVWNLMRLIKPLVYREWAPCIILLSRLGPFYSGSLDALVHVVRVPPLTEAAACDCQVATESSSCLRDMFLEP